MASLKTKYLRYHQYMPFVISDPAQHTMGSSLRRYVDIKVHHLIKQSDFNQLRVIGEYDRTCSISKFEKNDKVTNWQRPTAEVEDGVLYLKCFPGHDYVKHYASLVASYLAMNERPYEHVTYFEPTDEACWDAVDSIGLDEIPRSDVIVLGYGLQVIANAESWNGNDSILWTRKMIGKKSVTFLIVQFSYWGDILRRIVSKLGDMGFDTIIFTAKVGGIGQELIPNQDIVTGNSTLIDGEVIKWENIFSQYEGELKVGKHINSASVMFEVPSWLERMKNYDFVDSEIGEFAKGAFDSKLRFGYLHYISNLLSKHYSEDLSNERIQSVLEKREKIRLLMKKYIENTIISLS